MAGAEAQAGFYYQNIVAAGYALDLIVFGSSLRAITLESVEQAKYVDDIVAEYTDRTTFVQVKWAKNETSSLTLHNLVTPEDGSKSLLAKLARGYQQICEKPEQKEIILFSSRRAGKNRQPKQGFSKSLSEFLDEFHQPLVAAKATADIENLAASDDYSSILESLREATGLPKRDDLLEFLKCVQFKLDQPDIETMAERVRMRLVQLGIERSYYATLLDEIVNWSITKARVTPDDVRRVLGVHNRFVDRVSHHFPLDKEIRVPTPHVFDKLDSSIEALDSGFILLEGEPGSGKSTALTAYIEKRPAVSFGYYCFVPNDQSLGNERLEHEAFVNSICIGLKNAFPDVEFPKLYAPHTRQLLNDWLQVLSKAKQRVVFVVDGLDHVDRKRRQSLVEHPLTAVLDADDLPPNILIVLSSRYPEALSPSIINQVNADPRRRIKMHRFETSQIRQFLELRGVVLSGKILEQVVNVSQGVPIYLEYLADRLGEMDRYEQQQYLNSMPSLRDETIDAYHQQLWDTCQNNERMVYILAILASRNEFTTTKTLLELLKEVGVGSTLHTIYQDIEELRHVLRVSDVKSFAIRHSSLAEFVIEKTAHLRTEINQAIVAWYDQNPDSDDAWRNRLRHMWDRGKYSKILSICNDDWVSRAWECHRPIEEIQRNLDIAWRAASNRRDILEFIRVALLKQRVASVVNSLEISDVDVAKLLLYMDQPKEALRKVWDGERRQCRRVEFAAFYLEYIATVGDTLPDYIVNAGLGDESVLEAGISDTEDWYRAQSLIGDPIDVLEKIGHIHWERDEHILVRSPANEEDNERMNFKLQMTVLRDFALHGRLDSLEQIHVAETLPEALRVTAKTLRGILLAQKGERTEALRVLEGLDLSSLQEDDQRWLFLKLAEENLDGVLVDFTPGRPVLPRDLEFTNGSELNNVFFHLYDTLRCFFLHDETGIPWFETIMIGWPDPAKTLVNAIGRLAQLWTNLIRNEAENGIPLAEIKNIVSELNLRFDAYHLFVQVWSCAKLLSDNDLRELGRWWATTKEGELSLRFPEATRALARTIHEQTQNAASVCRQLLEVAERSERMDEETSAIGQGLLECVFAWAKCGFPKEAERLRRELLNVACGIYWRKDYQFNEIVSVLTFAHEDNPSGTLNRVEEQLILAHQLVGTVEKNTVSIAVEGLIGFLSKVDPALALEALHREEKLVYRVRAIQRIVRALLDNGTVDRRLMLSVAATMGHWDNHKAFDNYTNPTMFAIYSTALNKGDIATARSAYNLWRYILLVEKQIPAEIGQWAATWIETGNTPPDVENDYVKYSTQEWQGHEDPRDSEIDDDRSLSDELDSLVADFDRFDTRLEEGINQALLAERLSELESVRRDWQSAYVLAAGNAWSENASEIFDRCFAEFVKQVMKVGFKERLAAKTAVKDILCWFIHAVSEQTSCTVSFTDFENFYDIEKWLDRFVQVGSVPYQIEQMLKKHLPQWILTASPTDLDKWESLCNRRCTSDTRATGLLALAERYSMIDPNRAVNNLIGAWECISDFFDLYGKLSQSICSALLDLDKDKGTELLFESFRQQYEQSPESIIRGLGRLLDFANRLGPFNKVCLYQIWSAHNQILTSGLSEKVVNLSWLQDSLPPDFQQACLKYLVRLFDYPVIDVRLLALDELFHLTTERPEVISDILNSWSDFNDEQKEYIASLVFSLSIYETALAEQWLPRLIELGQQEQHRNLRAMIAEAVENAATNGAAFTPEILNNARNLKGRPHIIVSWGPVIHWQAPRRVWLPRYIRESLDLIAKESSSEYLEVQTQVILSQLYPSMESGYSEEMKVCRRYNINDNYDTIEIGGPYYNAAKSALNRSVQMMFNAHELDEDNLNIAEDVLRLRDPSDILVRKVQRPAQVCWIKEGITDEDFLEFHDLEDIKSGYALRDNDWVTIFEHTEQRIGDYLSSDPQRATKVKVMAFGVPQDAPCPTIRDVQNESRDGLLFPLRNCYRFELPRTAPPRGQGNIVPIVVATVRTFRGRQTPNMAALASDMAMSLSLVGADDLFGLVNQDGQLVVRSIEWQEAFDQGQRRHEPRSAGFMLQIKRDNLRLMAERERLHIFALVSAKRSTDRYKPEHEMDWAEHCDIFSLEVSGENHVGTEIRNSVTS